MIKASCSVLVSALTLFTPPLVWSQRSPEASKIPEQSVLAPASSVENRDTPRTPEHAPNPTTATGQTSKTNRVFEAEAPSPATAEQTEQPTHETTTDRSDFDSDWLEQVRAQRQARVNQYREAMETPRNYVAPWDHQYERIERQREKIREARQNRAEWREQAQRAYRRWANPHGEFLKDMHEAHLQLMEAQAENQRKQMDLLWQQQERWIYGHSPPGWNNPWYYRGF